MFLSQQEISTLTGYHPQQYKKQAKFLREHGYKFDMDIYGRPRVLVSHVEAELGSASKQQRKRSEPDFSMFDNRRTA